MKSFERFEGNRNWTAEESILLDQISRLAEEALAPRAAGYDERKEFPWKNIEDLRRIGLGGIFVPEEYGGAPVTYRCYLEVIRII